MRNQALEESRKLLKERNKHIQLPEKKRLGGCRLLCSGAAGVRLRQQRINRAVKESKILKAESRKPSKPRTQLLGRAQQSFTSNPNSLGTRRIVLPVSRQKLASSQGGGCFCCGRAGHFAKNCCAPIPPATMGKTY